MLTRAWFPQAAATGDSMGVGHPEIRPCAKEGGFGADWRKTAPARRFSRGETPVRRNEPQLDDSKLKLTLLNEDEPLELALFRLLLAGYAVLRPGNRFQPFLLHLFLAVRADAVLIVLDAL